MTETIPFHQEYRTSPQSSKLYLKRVIIDHYCSYSLLLLLYSCTQFFVFLNCLNPICFPYLPFQKLETALAELEELKPAVQAKLQELQYKQIYQLNKQQNSLQNETLGSSVEWPATRQNWNDYSRKQV